MVAMDRLMLMGISKDTALWWIGVCRSIGIEPEKIAIVRKKKKRRVRPDWVSEEVSVHKQTTDDEKRLSAMQEVQRMVCTYKGVSHVSIPIGGKKR